MSYFLEILLASCMEIVEIRSTQLHCSHPKELTSSLSCHLLVTTSRSWEVGWSPEDSIHEKTGLCSPTGHEGPGESPSKAFPEPIRSLLSSLNICKQGTARVTCVPPSIKWPKEGVRHLSNDLVSHSPVVI